MTLIYICNVKQTEKLNPECILSFMQLMGTIKLIGVKKQINEATSSNYPCGPSFTNVSAKVVSCSLAEIEGYNINCTCYLGEVVIK